MAESQKVTVVENKDGSVTVSTEPAKLLDIVTTLLSSDSALTGAYGLVQKAALVFGGMSLNSKIKTGSFNFIK